MKSKVYIEFDGKRYTCDWAMVEKSILHGTQLVIGTRIDGKIAEAPLFEVKNESVSDKPKCNQQNCGLLAQVLKERQELEKEVNELREKLKELQDEGERKPRKTYQFYECGWKCGAKMTKCVCGKDECDASCKHYPKTSLEKAHADCFMNEVIVKARKFSLMRGERDW